MKNKFMNLHIFEEGGNGGEGNTAGQNGNSGNGNGSQSGNAGYTGSDNQDTGGSVNMNINDRIRAAARR